MGGWESDPGLSHEPISANCGLQSQLCIKVKNHIDSTILTTFL